MIHSLTLWKKNKYMYIWTFFTKKKCINVCDMLYMKNQNELECNITIKVVYDVLLGISESSMGVVIVPRQASTCLEPPPYRHLDIIMSSNIYLRSLKYIKIETKWWNQRSGLTVTSSTWLCGPRTDLTWHTRSPTTVTSLIHPQSAVSCLHSLPRHLENDEGVRAPSDFPVNPTCKNSSHYSQMAFTSALTQSRSSTAPPLGYRGVKRGEIWAKSLPALTSSCTKRWGCLGCFWLLPTILH